MVKGVNPIRQHLILRKQYDNRFRKLFRVMIHQAAKMGQVQSRRETVSSEFQLKTNEPL